MKLLLVFFGGGIGSVVRYMVSFLLNGRIWPWGTLTVNIVGSFLIGILGAIASRGVISEEMRVFLIVGLCGGFTTFSTFSNECIMMIRNGDIGCAAIYMVVSVLVGLGATWVGIKI